VRRVPVPGPAVRTGVGPEAGGAQDRGSRQGRSEPLSGPATADHVRDPHPDALLERAELVDVALPADALLVSEERSDLEVRFVTPGVVAGVDLRVDPRLVLRVMAAGLLPLRLLAVGVALAGGAV